MKLMFIDDERNVTLGLQRIIDWGDYGFQIAGDASNGREGLDKIRTLRPDIVLLDIRMPGITGLELIRQAREQGFEGEFILLTAYPDFDYAHDAIRYGVVDYLLKPVDEEELLRAVLKAEKKIMTRNVMSLYGDQSLSAMRSNLFESALRGRLDQIDRRLSLRKNEPGRLIVISIQPSLLSPCEQVLDKVLGHSCIHCVLYNRIAVYLVGRQAIASQDTVLNSIRLLDSAAVFYAGEVLHDASLIPESFRSIARLIENIWFLRRADTALYETAQLRVFSSPRIFNWTEQDLSMVFCKALASHDTDRIDVLLKELRRYILGQQMTVSAAKVLLLQLFRSVCQYINLRFPEHFADSGDYPEQITIADSLETAISLIRQLALQTIERITQSAGQDVCQQILLYIEQNYAQPMQLQNLARKFGYDSGYLGKLLKQRTGHSFNAYLDNVRLRHACDLLRLGRPIATVAQQCGFSSVEYFSQKFRKTLGCSPTQFRRQL